MNYNFLNILVESYIKNPNSIEQTQKILNYLEPFLKNIIKKYNNTCWQEDLEQVARIGLLKAIRKYRSGYNLPFISFAFIYIKGEINHFLRDSTNLIHQPEPKKILFLKINKYIERYLIEHHHLPTVTSIMEHIKCNHKTALLLLFQYKVSNISTNYLSKKLGSNLNEYQYVNKIYIHELLTPLTLSERHLLEDFYISEMTQKEIAKKNNISQAQVSILLKKISYKARRHAT